MALNDKKAGVKTGTSDEETPDHVLTPRVDIYEEPDGTTILVAELPGVVEDGLDISVDKGVLTISASSNHQQPGDGYSNTYCSFSPGEYFRAFALSDEINRDAINAKLQDGVLTLHLPKAPEAQTHKIKIK